MIAIPISPKSFLPQQVAYHLKYSLGKHEVQVTPHDLYTALALSVRDQMVDRMIETEARYDAAKTKRVYYFSIEYLIGQSLENNLLNLHLFDEAEETVKAFGWDLPEIIRRENDAALGNGGLGRLAACLLDSMATLGIPGYGYGINYEFGLFRQHIDNGHQVEHPDQWQASGKPWQLERPELSVTVPVYGQVAMRLGTDGKPAPVWMEYQVLKGIPYDMPIVGYAAKAVNFLRLYSAKASNEFDIKIFNAGDYLKAVEQKVASERITKILYPDDSSDYGRELRLLQGYFFVACALQDILRKFEEQFSDLELFPEKVAIQLNDTHPALAIPELMRLLVDHRKLPWEKAWDITTRTFAYTNHTLLPEALEKWPVRLLEKVVPYHLHMIYEINQRFLDLVVTLWPDDIKPLADVSIIQEGPEKQVRMANLSIVGSHSVNGVAKIHTRLITENQFREFHHLWPGKFNNKTNGITQRRWLLKANPGLATLITEAIGAGWITNLDDLTRLAPFESDAGFRERFAEIKLSNKGRLARVIHDIGLGTVDPESLFDVQVKRIHEYKRQLLALMHVVHQYFCIIEDKKTLKTPRTYLFAGKAAPGYWAAKQIIKLIHNIAEVVNHDRRVHGQLKVIFLPNYRVSLAEVIIPAANVSEQISTAGREASGTGNMKFALNGALTVGTLDGANIEIGEEVGFENMFIFGLTAREIHDQIQRNAQNPWEYYYKNPHVKRVMDAFRHDTFCPREPGLFQWIFQSILHERDSYFHLADLGPYIKVQEQVSGEFQQPEIWNRKAIRNVAGIGRFSSDRTVLEYAKDIWGVEAVTVNGVKPLIPDRQIASIRTPTGGTGSEPEPEA